MAFRAHSIHPFFQSLLITLRRFIRWLANPKVFLSLIMLAMMIYLIIVPLYRMVETTLTFQDKDLIKFPDAEAGAFTFYHWTRMLTGKISQVAGQLEIEIQE